MLLSTYILSFLAGHAVGTAVERVLAGSGLVKTCTVPAGNSEDIDDGPAIIKAFGDCGQDGNVVFSNTTYHINSVMSTTGLKNCQVDIYGTLLVCCPRLISGRPNYDYKGLFSSRQYSGVPT